MIKNKLHLEVLRYSVVGALAFVLDNGGYTALVFGLPGSHSGPLGESPLAASAIATAGATLFAWAGNRYWTYRHQRRANIAHELALFIVVNIVALIITVAMVFLSRDILGLSSVLSDNAARICGWVLATIFRFFAYRQVVFVQAKE